MPASLTAKKAVPEPRIAMWFDVYNSTQGKKLQVTHTVPKSDEFKKIKLNVGFFNISNVDKKRIVVRERHKKGKLGKLIQFSNTGDITLDVPEQDKYYDVFLMNTSNGVVYYCLDFHKVKMINNKRYVTIIRRDNMQAGPNAILKKCFHQFNKALNPFGIRYGYLDYSTKYKSGDMSAGYGEVGDKGRRQPWVGTHWKNGFLVNIKKIGPRSRPRIKAIIMEETFEVYFGVDDICGSDSHRKLQQNGNLIGQGIDVIAYFALKSPAN